MPHVDVLIVGAGISGIDAAYRVATETRSKTVAILEARDAIGGTWDLFRYPGVRSDSDMFTLSFPFRAWTDAKTIADGSTIRDYVRDTAAEFGIDEKIRFGHRVTRAAWSSADARWTVDAQTADDIVVYTCNFLMLCSGYYNYADGHVVEFPGQESFSGKVIHPQHWPAGLDHAGKNIAVIGSGATAVTLVPALAERAAHVTMVQRSPSYVYSRPGKDAIADRLRGLLPKKLAHRLVRAKNIMIAVVSYQLFRSAPRRAAGLLRKKAQGLLGDVPVDPHFVPDYKPWDQRLCLVPDGDLFQALREDRASIVTDRIDTFTADGIRMASGKQVPADIIVTATGLRMVAFGQIELSVDGRIIDSSKATAYKGMMFSGIPNLAWCVGYTNNSWTLHVDLVSKYFCRLIKHMDRHGYTSCTPVYEGTPNGDGRPLLDLSSGYIKRAAGVLPKQGQRRPWRYRQSYLVDLVELGLRRVDDSAIRFESAGRRALTPVE